MKREEGKWDQLILIHRETADTLSIGSVQFFSLDQGF